MARNEIDRDKLRVRLRRLRKDDLLNLLDRAIDMVPKTRLPALVKGYANPNELRPDDTARRGLIEGVTRFHQASLRGDYYEDFMVNSRNFMEKSAGAKTWIAECERLFDLCVAATGKRPGGEVRQAFEMLFGLLGHIDECHDDVVFFADEGGAWQVGIDWRRVMPVYFASLAETSTPGEYARAVRGRIKDFVDHDRDRYLKAARKAASPAQKRALRDE